MPNLRTASTERPWTSARIVALGARTDVRTACAVLGMSERTGRELIRTGQFPVPVLRLGARKIVIPVAPILALLEIETPGDGSARDVA